MTAQVFAETLRPVEAMDALVARHGLMRVLIAVPVVLMKRRRAQVVVPGGMSSHMMRDIGLGSAAARSKSWEQG